jgi:hypothetical protein
MSLSSFIHQMKLANARKRQSERRQVIDTHGACTYSIVICANPASDSTDAQRAPFAVSSASASSACPYAPMTLRFRIEKEKWFSRYMVSVPVKPNAISAVFFKEKKLAKVRK